MLLVSTNGTHCIMESDTSTSHLVTAGMGFAIIVTAICPGLAMMQLEIGVNGVDLGVDVLGGISKDYSKLFIRQQLMPIQCHNRFLSFFQ